MDPTTGIVIDDELSYLEVCSSIGSQIKEVTWAIKDFIQFEDIRELVQEAIDIIKEIQQDVSQHGVFLEFTQDFESTKLKAEEMSENTNPMG